MKNGRKIEFGDFQTPLTLARDACLLLVAQGVQVDAVVEPTCGRGAFLVAAAKAFPTARMFGWDINHDYVQHTKSAMAEEGVSERVIVAQQDFFAHDWASELSNIHGRLLILGNLPWVTNAVVSGINGSNLPAKENFLGLRGLDARTGKSNFDISEWMLICLVKALRGRAATIAMLCKTSTARKVLRYSWQNDGRIARASLYRIDTKGHFGAAVDACLLVAHLAENGAAEAPVFDGISPNGTPITLGLAGH